MATLVIQPPVRSTKIETELANKISDNDRAYDAAMKLIEKTN